MLKTGVCMSAAKNAVESLTENPPAPPPTRKQHGIKSVAGLLRSLTNNTEKQLQWLVDFSEGKHGVTKAQQLEAIKIVLDRCYGRALEVSASLDAGSAGAEALASINSDDLAAIVRLVRPPSK